MTPTAQWARSRQLEQNRMPYVGGGKLGELGTVYEVYVSDSLVTPGVVAGWCVVDCQWACRYSSTYETYATNTGCVLTLVLVLEVPALQVLLLCRTCEIVLLILIVR